MTITLRPADQRGHADHGWLNTYHSFSFANYYDPAHMGYRDLRVINDDVIAAGAGFPTHGHNDMEIVSYVVRGSLAHKDSTGSAGVLRRGDVQTMSAGRGVRHSEYNPSPTEDMRLLQIWMLPAQNGLDAGYNQKGFSAAEKTNRLRLIASGDGRDGSLPIHQDASIYASLLEAGQSVTHILAAGRGAWVQMVDGELDLNGQILRGGDGAAIENAGQLVMRGISPAEFLLFDLV